MSRSGNLSLGIALFTLLAVPALGGSRIPGDGGLPALPNAQVQMQRQMMTAPKPATPYPMTYSEQVARSLGVHQGQVQLYDSGESARNSYAPSVSLGGTMVRLRWRQ